jgi:hypothetical protein
MTENTVKTLQKGEYLKYFDIPLVLLVIVSVIIVFLLGNPVSVFLLPLDCALVLLVVSQRIGLIPSIPSNKEFRNLPPGYDIKELTQVIKNSEKFVNILSGELDHHIWDDKTILQEIYNALDHGVEFTFVCGPNFDIQDVELAKLIDSGKITLYKLDTKEMEHHFRINDKHDTLYHCGEDHDKDIFVYYNNKNTGDEYVKYFYTKIRHGAKKVGPGEFYTMFQENLQNIDDNGNRTPATEIQKQTFLIKLNNS